MDGALLYELRLPFGYWEAKDEKDDLDAEIALKLKRGYPQDNIIFEDSREAVLLQSRTEVMRCAVDDVAALEKLLRLFFGFENPKVVQFRKAVEQFQVDLPDVLEALRAMIEDAHSRQPSFRQAAESFLAHARETINRSLTEADVREMLIQHILTEEIFAAVFPGTPFHQDNNVARELYKLEGTFFTGNTKFQTLKGLEPYYSAIRSAAAQVATHHEKQNFLKVIYEGFYKVYNPKAADRLGVVYTPNEIVRFMIESADWLCEQHFGRNLIDKDVEILDPATGTGTFVCELLEHFRGQPAKLKHKYREELHANEVAILPYYVANLNIEATYAAITGQYEEFPNLCFVDTLDNVGLHTAAFGTQGNLLGSVSEENVARIRRQNARKISVILGNPPYNANQLNENENNKNREYDEIDRRIKATYIAESTAQKTKLYDMYSRFLRWASDRVDKNGIIAFVSNSSFIDSRTFDGFRKVVAAEFNEIRMINLKGNARTSGERRRKEGGNVFDDQSKSTKAAIKSSQEKAVFKVFSLGVVTNRDEWAYDANPEYLVAKMSALIDTYNRDRRRLSTLKDKAAIAKNLDTSIKWTRSVKNDLRRGIEYEARPALIVESYYRPFVKRHLYFSRQLNEMVYQVPQLFGPEAGENRAFCFATEERSQFGAIAFDTVPNKDVFMPSAVQVLARYRYDSGERLDNITDWALDQFKKHYQPGRGKKVRPITKDAIFHYVYGVFHDPIYREKYAQNLKRELPRIPFYTDFWQWADWGQTLMDLHIGYETVEPFPLRRADVPDERAKNAGQAPKAMLKADKDAGSITLDSETVLSGVPSEAWDYQLGNRSALEWVLDQYKEKKPKDPTIRAKFDTYRFADYKEKVIDLLMRVTAVSVATVEISRAMRSAAR